MTSFAQARIEAESCARAWLPETQADVTMWNIYSAMMQNLGVSDDCVGQMTYNEREAEIKLWRIGGSAVIGIRQLMSTV